jgi:4-amino-4-deoxy-L-arabinose transferase-like glycosyltransferase
MTATLQRPAAPPADHRPARRPARHLAVGFLLAATALLYLWDLGASGWANAYYSAAAQAGAANWKALFFGATDAAGGITLDKTPASVWLMALSVKVFGLSSWSVLVPQALEGVAAVGLLYATVRRVAGPAAGLLAGAAFALTPVAVLMFRFNNPDALLTLLLVAGAYCTVRATEKASVRWLMLAGAAVGFAFLTKMLQAFLVLPAFGLAYLVAAPTGLGRRIAHLGAGLGAMVVAGGWWVLAVELTPAGSRPFIGGSQTNSVLELTLGYNGFGRLTGDEVGSVGGSPGGGWGSTGWSRLFSGEMAGGIAWLLPAAVLALGLGLWLTRRAPRTDRTRAALILWGGWLLLTAAVFSLMQGIIHPYYTVALAPAIAALVGTGALLAWRHRHDVVAAGGLSAGVVLTTLTAYALLNREPSWQPWLRPVVLMFGLAAAGLIVLVSQFPIAAQRIVAVVALVVVLLPVASYGIATAAQSHTGAIPSAGPAGTGFGPRFGGGGNGGGFTGGGPRFGAGGGGGGFGGMGGLLNATTPGTELTSLLRNASGKYTWVAAVVGSNNAAGYQLAAGKPVLAVGGFNGTDPFPTLEQFQAYVHSRAIRYFIGGSMMEGNGGSDLSAQIAAWVARNYPSSTVDGVTVYDLGGSQG